MRPVKISTPMQLMTKSIMLLARKMLTMDAMMMPNRPIIRKLPMPVRSRLVTVPYTDMARKVPVAVRKALAMEPMG